MLYSCISFESRQFLKRIYHGWPLRGGGPGAIAPVNPALGEVVPRLRSKRYVTCLSGVDDCREINHCPGFDVGFSC